MADRRIGQQAFEIMLEDGAPGAEQQRRQTHAADDQIPALRPRQDGPEADQQEDPRLHHGRGVQIGADRRRRGHGAGQPEVERKLRALGHRAEQQQNQRGQIQRAGLDRLARRQDDIEVVAADDPPDQDHPDQQGDAAHGRHRQRHSRPFARGGVLVPIADQKEGKEAGQLPEYDQLNQIARQHHALHRAHEGQQEGEEPRHRILRRHVVAGIQHHQGADPQDQGAEQPRQSIQSQHQIDAQRRQPRDLVAQRLPVLEHRP